MGLDPGQFENREAFQRQPQTPPASFTFLRQSRECQACAPRQISAARSCREGLASRQQYSGLRARKWEIQNPFKEISHVLSPSISHLLSAMIGRNHEIFPPVS